MSQPSLSLRTRLILVAAIELAYMAISRAAYALRDHGAFYAEIEVIRTIPRLIAAALIWRLMRDVINALPTDRRPLRSPVLITALALAFTASVLAGGYKGLPIDAAVIALASWPVALHEELFFRAVLQTVAIHRLGNVRGIAVTVVVFTLFHFGVSQPSFANFAGIALMGIILGVVYAKTHSLLAVIVIHGLDDTILSLPPLIPVPSLVWNQIALVLAAGTVLWWGRSPLASARPSER